MKKLFIFSLITSYIVALMACKDNGPSTDLKEAKTTREAIKAISGVEYRLTNNDSIYIKLTDIGSKDETLLGSKLAQAGIVSNIKFIENSDPNKPYEYIEEYYNQTSQNRVSLWNFKIYLHADTLEVYYKRTKENFIFKQKSN
jgi:hypothetical protein